MSSTQGRIEFLLNELQQRTEQLVISEEHVAKLQEENRRLAAVETEYRRHLCPPRTTADHHLAADIEALTERVAKVESCMFTADSFEKAVGYVVKDEIDKACRIGGILSRRG